MIVIDKKRFNVSDITINYNSVDKNNIEPCKINVDSFLLIPGVTMYKNIYSVKNNLFLENGDSFIQILFESDSDVYKFYNTITREIKIEHILSDKK